MKGEELIINFDGDKAHLSNQCILSLQQFINLPSIAKRFNAPAAWKVRVLNYDPSNNIMFVEILSYTTDKLKFLQSQLLLQSKLNKIEKIRFKGVDTVGLLASLSGKGGVRTIVPNIEAIPDRTIGPQSISPQIVHAKREPQVQTIKETFQIPINNLQFKYGGVTFDKRIGRLGKKIGFTITNNNIREEFDAVKNYFANVLKTKKIQVDISIQLTDNEITSIGANSADIDRIDQTIIDNVKLEFIKYLTKERNETQTNKALLTMDELFDAVTDEQVKAEVFYENEGHFFDDLLKITDTKHYQHLRFLSEKHDHSVMKLQFLVKPFSFVFLIRGENNYHIVWETLNTEEATYIWHESKDANKLKLALHKIEKIISAIKVQGKTNYIHSADESFKRIYHDYSNLVGGFVKWKDEIESVLI